MQNWRQLQTGILLGSLVLTLGACKREATAPELQTTTGQQARMQPVTVTGCLKSGMASDTFVLMTSQANGTASDTATYQLTGREGINLRQYLGQKVEVAGTVRDLERGARASLTAPAELSAAFSRLAPLARDVDERGVVLYDRGRPFAWAGTMRVPTDSLRDSIGVDENAGEIQASIDGFR